MSKRILLANYLLSLFLACCFMALPLSLAYAEAEHTLFVDYNSGAEEKIVITGQVIPLEAERVYTKTELRAFNTKLYYFSAIASPGGEMYYYAVDGVSMWDIFDHAGLGEDIYKGAGNFLYTVSKDKTTIGMGQGIEITVPMEYFPIKTGALNTDRYTYPMDDFIYYTGANGERTPWVLGFAEYRVPVNFGIPATVPTKATDSSYALRAYFGQLDGFHKNHVLFNSHVYRIVFSGGKLTTQQASNDSDNPVFALFGEPYDRANILTGPDGGAEKITGRFVSGSDTVHIAGTSVSSLLPQTLPAEEYIAFSYGAGKTFTVPLQDLATNNYTLVYATGQAADTLLPIQRQLDGATYYFDLYRNGAAPIENITAMAFAAEPVEPKAVISVYQGSTLLKQFTDNDIPALESNHGLSGLAYSASNGTTRQEYNNISGIPISKLLQAAGADTVADNTLIRLSNSDGAYVDFTAHQLLTQPRYYFAAGETSSTTAAPAIINFDDADGGSFYIGQAAAQEPTAAALMQKMCGGTIIIEDVAGKHAAPKANPQSGSVKQGEPIRLTGAEKQAYIYYTLDDSEPTVKSQIYDNNAPIAAPSSAQFILKARIIGFGKTDGEVTSFTYNKPSIPSSNNPSSKGSSGNSSTVAQLVDIVNPPLSDTAPALTQQLSFTDVAETAYFHDSLYYVVEKGLFTGYADGSFQPQLPLSRAMAATVLWRLAEKPQTGGHSFVDVPANAYYNAAVAWAAEKGVILGYQETQFAPHDNITREQFVVMLFRYAQSMGYTPNITTDLSSYKDAAAVSAYASEAMAWAVSEGLINGVTADLLAPQATIDRAQAAVILHRFETWLDKQ